MILTTMLLVLLGLIGVGLLTILIIALVLLDTAIRVCVEMGHSINRMFGRMGLGPAPFYERRCYNG